MTWVHPTLGDPSPRDRRDKDGLSARFRIPHETTTRVTGESTTTASAAYVNIPGTRVQVVGFVKYRDDTKLTVTISGSAVQVTAGANVFYGVNFNGADFDVATIQTPAATRLPAVGTREFTGTAKGTYTFEMRVKVSAGTWTPDSVADTFCITVRETY